MISQAFINSVFPAVWYNSSTLLSVSVFLSLTFLLLWRLWTFTIVPAIYPNDPKQLPYWIPVIGHMVSFYKNPSALQSYARWSITCRPLNGYSLIQYREYFNNSRQVFALTLAGTKLYILTNPRDISEAYRNSPSLSFDVFVKLLIRTCGSSKAVVDKLYQNPLPSNKRETSLGRAIHTFQVQQSSPGQNLEDLSALFVSYFEKSLVLDKMARDSRYGSRSSETSDTCRLSLSKWCSEVVINANQQAYFGNSLSEIDPDLAQTFIEFDTRSWQLLYHFPRIISQGMYAAKDRLIDALTAYFETLAGSKTDAAWVTQLLEREMRGLGFTNREMGTLMMLQYWGINTNTHKACFWMLSYGIFEPGLLEAIRTETAKAFVNDSLDYHYLEESCPRLQGLWLEVLRLTVSSSSVRYLTQDSTIGGKILRSGNVLINSCRQLHFDESVFGQNVFEFDSRRFVDNPKLVGSPSWKPFGGGISLCPGRFVARRAACIFISLILHRFDIKFAFPQSFPRAEQSTPDLGIFTSPDDLILTIERRSTD